MKPYLPLGIGALLIIGIGAFVFMQNNDIPAPAPLPDTSTLPAESGAQTTDSTGSAAIPPSTEAGQPTPSSPSPSSAPTPSGITASEVATHASRESCWSTINGNVYDLTSWIPKHPGGEGAILGICGKDGSGKFNGKHGNDAKKVALLSGFKIGVAAK